MCINFTPLLFFTLTCSPLAPPAFFVHRLFIFLFASIARLHPVLLPFHYLLAFLPSTHSSFLLLLLSTLIHFVSLIFIDHRRTRKTHSPSTHACIPSSAAHCPILYIQPLTTIFGRPTRLSLAVQSSLRVILLVLLRSSFPVSLRLVPSLSSSSSHLTKSSASSLRPAQPILPFPFA